jgi:hypothetical protein
MDASKGQSTVSVFNDYFTRRPLERPVLWLNERLYDLTREQSRRVSRL